MQFVCDAPPNTWFRIETLGEAALESQLMNHAVEKFFRQAHDQAAKSYVPPKSRHVFEQSIGLKPHIQKVMPLFLTLRNNEGKALVTTPRMSGRRRRDALRSDYLATARLSSTAP